MRTWKAAIGLALLSVGCGPGAFEEPAVVEEITGLLQVEHPIKGQYIVKLRDGAGDVNGLAGRLLGRHGGELLQTYSDAIAGFAARLPEGAARALAADPDVAFVEEDAEMYAVTTQAGATWGLDRVDQRTRPLGGSYVYTNTGAGVNAYVVDTGIRTTHVDFGGRATGAFTAVNDGNGTNDCNGHGTHVAGTIGGNTYGIAKGVRLHAVRVLGCNGSGSTSGIISALDWIRRNHVKPAVANMSLGGGASSSLDTAVANTAAAGVTMVVAAGNSNADACRTSPARAPAAITVGATTSSDARASYSNWGTCLDLFAPGSSIRSAYNTSDTATASSSGTSMASPHVAGVAALYLQSNPGATAAAVSSAITANATTGVVSNARTGSPNRLLYSAFIGAAASP